MGSISTLAALDAIASRMNGQEWDADTLEHIAETLRQAGYKLGEPDEPPAKQMPWFTVFVQEADGTGTTHVSSHQCRDVQAAMRAALNETSGDWGEEDHPLDSLRVVGVIAGNVDIIEWSDFGIDSEIDVDLENDDE